MYPFILADINNKFAKLNQISDMQEAKKDEYEIWLKTRIKSNEAYGMPESLITNIDFLYSFGDNNDVQDKLKDSEFFSQLSPILQKQVRTSHLASP